MVANGPMLLFGGVRRLGANMMAVILFLLFVAVDRGMIQRLLCVV